MTTVEKLGKGAMIEKEARQNHLALKDRVITTSVKSVNSDNKISREKTNPRRKKTAKPDRGTGHEEYNRAKEHEEVITKKRIRAHNMLQWS